MDHTTNPTNPANLPAPSTCQYNEQVILEHCRWLFNQDVRIITFLRPTHTPFSSLITTYESTAIVLPKTTTLHSLTEAKRYSFMDSSANSKILIMATHTCPMGKAEPTRDAVIAKLLHVVQERIGEVMQVNVYGRIIVERESLPKGYCEN